MEHAGPVRLDGSLTEAAIVLLHAVSRVDIDLLRAARIRPARTNWLHAPWYPYARGGAITVGRRIWFTRIWFDPKGFGDGSLGSTWNWLLLLAHEVGHLPQAERFGRSFFAKARYVAAFSWQYCSRALLLRRPLHDGSRLECEAELGRWVLLRSVDASVELDPLVKLVHSEDTDAVKAWCRERSARVGELQRSYHAEFLKGRR
jgi:hypothetical protein